MKNKIEKLWYWDMNYERWYNYIYIVPTKQKMDWYNLAYYLWEIDWVTKIIDKWDGWRTGYWDCLNIQWDFENEWKWIRIWRSKMKLTCDLWRIELVK